MISRFIQFFKLNSESLFWGALTGILVGTSYIPFPPWAILFCYLPLWFFVTKKTTTWRQALLAAWMAQFVLTLIGFHWISYVAHEFGFLPWPIAIAVLLLFASAMHLYIPLSIFLGLWLGQKFRLEKGAVFLLFASLLALSEHFWPSIFNWNMGYTLLWSGSPLAQWADVVGFEGLSFSIYLINAGLLWLIFRKSPRVWLISGFSLILVLSGLYWGGLQRQEKWKSTNASLQTLIVQANIGNFEKLMAEKGSGFQQSIADQFFQLTQEGLHQHPQTELVVWPESAFPDFLDDFARSRTYASQLHAFTRSIQKALLTGAYSKDPPVKKVRDDYNGVFLFNPNGELVGEPYHKTQLLAFGEYVPLARTFPIIAKYNPLGVGFGRGSGPMTWNLNGTFIGVQICYESLDPDFSAELSQKGAEILVNVTNDSWFGPRFEPLQHLYMTLARAIETRRPLIRSTNTGISSVILADGTILEKSPVYQKWFGAYDVKFQKNPELTFHSRFGSWLWAVIFVFVGAVIWRGRNHATISSS
jgi:apolipoprotein N-acyltransferase